MKRNSLRYFASGLGLLAGSCVPPQTAEKPEIETFVGQPTSAGVLSPDYQPDLLSITLRDGEDSLSFYCRSNCYREKFAITSALVNGEIHDGDNDTITIEAIATSVEGISGPHPIYGLKSVKVSGYTIKLD